MINFKRISLSYVKPEDSAWFIFKLVSLSYGTVEDKAVFIAEVLKKQRQSILSLGFDSCVFRADSRRDFYFDSPTSRCMSAKDWGDLWDFYGAKGERFSLFESGDTLCRFVLALNKSDIQVEILATQFQETVLAILYQFGYEVKALFSSDINRVVGLSPDVFSVVPDSYCRSEIHDLFQPHINRLLGSAFNEKSVGDFFENLDAKLGLTADFDIYLSKLYFLLYQFLTVDFPKNPLDIESELKLWDVFLSYVNARLFVDSDPVDTAAFTALSRVPPIEITPCELSLNGLVQSMI